VERRKEVKERHRRGNWYCIKRREVKNSKEIENE
jgi:hypothetical protein